MRQWPFAGRAGELAEILSSLLGGEAAGVVISGEAGVGKTRLAREVLASLASEGWHTACVAASGAMASIPFGAVSTILPADQVAGNQVLSSMITQVRAWGEKRPVVIGVDDAHLLDDGSAALLGHLGSCGLASMVVTCRPGTCLPDAITTLWKDGQALWLDLARLPAAAVDELLDHALTGDIDGVTRRRLHGIAAGNPLALREVVSGALTDRALRQSYGVWRLTGDYRPNGGVRHLLADRLRPIDAQTRLVLELLACGEPYPHALLATLVAPECIDEAEARDLVVSEHDGRRVRLRLAHPLYGEVLRADLPVGRSRHLSWRLADALLRTPLRRRDDLLRAALWQVDSGAVVRADVVRQGARQAVDRADLALAERLARAARDAEPCVEADALLAEVLEYRGRSAEAAGLLPEEPPSGDDDLLAWALVRAETAYWGHGDVVAAEQALDLLKGRPGEELAQGIRTWILLFDGRCAAVLPIADELLAGDAASPQAVIWATAAATAAAGCLGRAEDAASYHERGLALATAHQAELPWGVVELDIARCLASLAMGDLRTAWKVADDGYHRVLAGESPMMSAGHAGFRGLAECAQGRLGRADRSLREAVSALEGRDTLRLTRTFVAGLATASALRGQAVEARTWMERAEPGVSDVNRLLAPWITLGNAWTLAAEGRLTDAALAARYAADLARGIGLPTVEALARYDVLRLRGGGGCGRLDELDAAIGTPMSHALAAAARGLRQQNGAALSAAADAFADLGQQLLAAEAATCAAGLYRQAGLTSTAALARERAASLRARCEGAVTPLLEHEPISGVLTPREREVALLAVRHSSRTIAEQLGLSVATVNNTLARAYSKLGVSSRAQLAALLAP